MPLFPRQGFMTIEELLNILESDELELLGSREYNICGYVIVKHPNYERGLECWKIKGDCEIRGLVFRTLNDAREYLSCLSAKYELKARVIPHRYE